LTWAVDASSMLYVGSDDGAYRLPGALDPTDEGSRDSDGTGSPSDDREAAGVAGEQVLDSGAVMRLRRLDRVGPGGLFAATATGLYHSVDGDHWVDLDVPRESVYAVGASADGETLYAGTRPAHLYATTAPGAADAGDDGTGGDDASDGDGDGEGTAGALDASALDWRECEGFQALPSREDWRLPRHEDLAHVRDVKGLPGRPAEVVAAVEVGGVHASADRGGTWVERRGPVTDPRPEDRRGDDVDWSATPGDVHDDVHELAVVAADEWVAATGFGLFRTTDAGGSWTRLDEDVEPGYVRTVAHHDGTTYVAAATESAGNWDDPDVDSGFFTHRHGEGLREVAVPTPDEVVTGVVAVDDDVFAGTHQGTLLHADGDRDGEWTAIGSFPTDSESGTYTPLASLDERTN
jgi:hypothetical protein